MKLSVYNIFEELFFSTGTLVTEGPVSFDLDGVRSYRDAGTDFAENHIYIVTLEQFLHFHPHPHLHLICIGIPKEADTERNFQAVIFLAENTDPLEVLASTQDLFDRYQVWMNSIHTAIFQGKPLQYILDLCSAFLKNPVALFDNQQSLLMKAGNIPENLEGSLWGYVLKKGYSPQEAESEYIRTQLQQNRRPFYYRSKDQFRNANRLVAGIHHHNTLFGTLGISDINATFTNSEYANVCFIQEFIEIALLHSDEYKSYVPETPWYITQLLQGNTMDRGVISYNLIQKGKMPDQAYFIWTFLPLANIITDSFSIQHSIANFKKHFKTEFVFIYKNEIIVIDYQLESYNQKAYFESVYDFLYNCSFKGAFSMIFQDIYELHQAYAQCRIALESSLNNSVSIHDFRKQYVNYIIDSIHKERDINDLLYPGIKRLLQKDKGYGLELVHCLQEYIIHGRNTSATAQSLFVHRHTVIYRLNNISEIMKIDMDTLDEDSLLQLYLSCRVLLKHYSLQ